MDRGKDVVGRDAELAAVDAVLGSPRSKQSAVPIDGEAGIGKTTVWRESVSRAEQRGNRVRTSVPVAPEQHLSFMTLGDLLGTVLDVVLARLPPPQCRALRIALLDDASGAPPDPRAIALAVSSPCHALATDAPVLVGIDDAQWLDSPTRAAFNLASRCVGDLVSRVPRRAPPRGRCGRLGQARVVAAWLG